MATTKEIFDREFNSLMEDLIKEYDRLGMRASGNWEDSLEVQTTEESGKIIGEKYSEQLEYGRRSGGFPPVQAIEKWIIDKGIVSKIQGEISVSSLAFLIARKIAREGWNREGFGGVELISNVVTDQRMQKIIDLLGPEIATTFSDKLEKELVTMFN
jgi:hypothetical protein